MMIQPKLDFMTYFYIIGGLAALIVGIAAFFSGVVHLGVKGLVIGIIFLGAGWYKYRKYKLAKL